MMLSLRIALRYLFSPKSHTAVNVISLISMAGIAVAAMAMVCVLSVFNGFRDLASDRLSAIDPDLLVTPADGRVILSADSVAAAVAGLSDVRAAAPVLEQKALAISGEAQIPVTVKGVPEGYSAVTGLMSTVIDGVMADEPDSVCRERYGHSLALLSVGAAVASGARPSLERPLLLTAPRRLGRVNPALPIGAFVTDTLLVCGVFQTNEQETDGDRVVVPLSSARRLFDYASEASAIEVALAPGADPEEAETRLRAMLGDGYEVADRLRQQEDSYRMIEIEKWITFAMLIFVLVMASFNVLSTMSMLMIEKAGNMHIMRAMGASDALLGRIFMLEGLLIAAVGGAAGIAAGVILSLLQQHLGIISLGGDHTQMSVLSYPCRLALPDVLLTAAVVAAIGFISGLTASRKG